MISYHNKNYESTCVLHELISLVQFGTEQQLYSFCDLGIVTIIILLLRHSEFSSLLGYWLYYQSIKIRTCTCLPILKSAGEISGRDTGLASGPVIHT